MTSAALAPRHLIAWRNAVFVVFSLGGVGLASWVARVPSVRDALGADTVQMGWLIFGLSAGSIAGLLGASHLLAWLGARRMIAASVTLFSIGLIIAATGTVAGPSFAVIFAGLAVFGAGMSTCDVAMNVTGAANERRLGRNIMPLFHAAFSGGTVVGAAVGALAEALHVPIVMHITVIAALTLAVLPVAVRFVPHDSSHDSPPDPSPDDRADAGAQTGADAEANAAPALDWRERLAVWRSPRVLLIGLIVLGMAFTEGSANDWLALASVDGHGVDNALGAVILGVFVASMTAGRLLGPFVLDRYGRVAVLRGCAALAVAGLLMFIYVPVLPIAIAGVVLWGLGASLGFPVGMSAAADDPRTAGANVSAVATIGYCAFLIGPPLIGAIGQLTGLLHALLLVLVLIALAGAVSHAARSPHSRR